MNRFLSMLQFSETDLQQKIGTLSGGQHARVTIAQCLLSGAAVIVLDEPTNHLDITSTQVMERALTHFPGAVIVVSHDRFFVDKLADRLLVSDKSCSAPEQLQGRMLRARARLPRVADAGSDIADPTRLAMRICRCG
ncbi:ATP-binding cassette domain-containing protein [Agromyces sp. NPDC056523]|uniref:ATP-binding cassette domain-containing protein n=1 Tax=Agromyces sp. NPDC056523 TaxID=3345850 RepID=UPI0036725A5A